MADNNTLLSLFTVGMTRQQFLDKVFELTQKKKTEDDLSSVFNGKLSAESAGLIFDAIDILEKDGVLSEDEINGEKGLRNLDKSEGENILSEKDISKLYQNMNEQIMQAFGDKTKTPQDLLALAKESGLYTDKETKEFSPDIYVNNLMAYSDLLDSWKIARQDEYANTVKDLQGKINALIENSHKVDAKIKSNIRKATKNLEKENREKLQLEHELEKKQEQLNVNRIALNTIIERKNNGYKVDENEIKDLESNINDLGNNISKLESKLNKVMQNIQIYQADLDNYEKQAFSQDNNIKTMKNGDGQTVDDIKLLINKAEADYKNDIVSYDEKRKALSSTKDYVVNVSPETKSNFDMGADYSTDVPPTVTPSAKELAAKWADKAQYGVNEAFCQKVIDIAKEVNCDPAALMGVMNSECGLNSKAQNKHGGASGLIQFMPKTAKAMGTTTDAIVQMSPLKQLDLVKEFLFANKRMAKIGKDDYVDNATLYTLVFLPAFAKRDVLTRSGEKYYDWNKGLDINKDGVITKQDMAARVRKFMR